MRNIKSFCWLTLALILVYSAGFSQVRKDRKVRSPLYSIHEQWAPKTPPSLIRRSYPDFSRNHILVDFLSSASSQNIGSTLAHFGVKTHKKLSVLNTYKVAIPDGGTVEETIYALNLHPLVKYARPDYIAGICVTPNDTFFSYQYGLYNSGQSIGVPGSPQGTSRADIKATAAWEESKGDSELLIAIIDTGVDLLHPDLVNKIASDGHDFVNNDQDATDDQGHGTMVAGVAAAETNNNEGVAGVAWNCRVLPVKVMDSDGTGLYSWIIEGIVWAVDNGASVINLSIGGTASDPALEAAVKYAFDNDVVVIASAGNDAEAVLFPAAYDDYCLAVGATDYNDTSVSWSNFGPEVDVAAPGERIATSFPTWYWGPGSIPYGFADGTSFSAPFVAGFAALLKSLKPWMSTDEIMNVIRYSSDDINSTDFPGPDDYIGYGRINMETALLPLKITGK